MALDLYLRLGVAGRKHPEVIRVSEFLNNSNFHQDRPDRAKYRNPNGVSLKLANFAALDPDYPGRGMSGGGRLDATIWTRYASNEDTLSSVVAEILRTGGFEKQSPIEVEDSGVFEVDVESQHVERFEVPGAQQAREAQRKEHRLVLDFADHLAELGHTVKRHRYAVPGETGLLACDLVDQTERTLYEAKSDLKRNSIRLAIGQLLDYRRFEPEDMRIALLLPRKPPPDLKALALSVPVSATWRTRDGWAELRH